MEREPSHDRIKIEVLQVSSAEGSTYHSRKQKLQDVHLNFVVLWASQ